MINAPFSFHAFFACNLKCFAILKCLGKLGCGLKWRWLFIFSVLPYCPQNIIFFFFFCVRQRHLSNSLKCYLLKSQDQLQFILLFSAQFSSFYKSGEFMKFKVGVSLIVFFYPGFSTWILREECKDCLYQIQ